MEFTVTEEQKMLIESVRRFVEQELYPHEDEVEKADQVSSELRQEIVRKAIELGFYAVNMPVELGGGGLIQINADQQLQLVHGRFGFVLVRKGDHGIAAKADQRLHLAFPIQEDFIV